MCRMGRVSPSNGYRYSKEPNNRQCNNTSISIENNATLNIFKRKTDILRRSPSLAHYDNVGPRNVLMMNDRISIYHSEGSARGAQFRSATHIAILQRCQVQQTPCKFPAILGYTIDRLFRHISGPFGGCKSDVGECRVSLAAIDDLADRGSDRICIGRIARDEKVQQAIRPCERGLSFGSDCRLTLYQ